MVDDEDLDVDIIDDDEEDENGNDEELWLFFIVILNYLFHFIYLNWMECHSFTCFIINLILFIYNINFNGLVKIYLFN